MLPHHPPGGRYDNTVMCSLNNSYSDTNDDFEQRLPKDKLVLLVGCAPVVTFMCQCDYMLYQCIVDVLIPEVLRHIPGELTVRISLREFILCVKVTHYLFILCFHIKELLVKILITLASIISYCFVRNSYTSYPQFCQESRRLAQLKPTRLPVNLHLCQGAPLPMCDMLILPFPQLAAVVAFSQTLRRYTSLNHLAQAARAVLQNSTQISQMLADLNRVDFANVQVCVIVHVSVCNGVCYTGAGLLGMSM